MLSKPFLWTSRELRMAVVRLAALSLIRGWCLTKIPAFPFQKAAKNCVWLDALKWPDCTVSFGLWSASGEVKQRRVTRIANEPERNAAAEPRTEA